MLENSNSLKGKMPRTLLFLKSALVILLLSFTACDPVTRANGVVRSREGKPIENVKIVMEGAPENGGFRKESEQVTKADGSFNFVTITEPSVQTRLTFSKEGYKSFQKDITPNRENNLEIVLEGEPES